jgi:SAM-dependent methyltransferase
MFGWYRGQIGELGALQATYLLGRVAWSRTKVNLANKLLPVTIACPCCGWSGRRFYDYIEVGYTSRNSACPQCDSHSRHRALFRWLNQEYQLQNKRGIALVFAPEAALAPVWERATNLRVYRVDLEAIRGPDLLGDMRRLPVASDAIDLLWCHHVLEHIDDDRAAIRELYRVLRSSTGELIVSVPMYEGQATREYGYADPNEPGHWRIYGADFVDRLAESGFEVRSVVSNLSEQDCARFRIDREPFYICTKKAAGQKTECE